MSVGGKVSGGELHPQVRVPIFPLQRAFKGAASIECDQKIAKVVAAINDLGYATYESCQNYGEYLRWVGLGHVHESLRDYAYVEFYELDDAMAFIGQVQDVADVAGSIYHQLAHEGTPGAWELKYRQTTGQWWIWFPSSSIKDLEGLLDAEVQASQQA